MSERYYTIDICCCFPNIFFLTICHLFYHISIFHLYKRFCESNTYFLTQITICPSYMCLLGVSKAKLHLISVPSLKCLNLGTPENRAWNRKFLDRWCQRTEKGLGGRKRKWMQSHSCIVKIPTTGIRNSVQMGLLQSMKNAFQNVPSSWQEAGEIFLLAPIPTRWRLPETLTVPSHASHLALTGCVCVVWEGCWLLGLRQTNNRATQFTSGWDSVSRAAQPTRAVVEIKMSWGNEMWDSENRCHKECASVFCSSVSYWKKHIHSNVRVN